MWHINTGIIDIFLKFNKVVCHFKKTTDSMHFLLMQIWVFQQKLKFGELGSFAVYLTASLCLKTYDEISADISKYDLLILYNKMCQHLKNLHNAVNDYFPKVCCMMLQNHT